MIETTWVFVGAGLSALALIVSLVSGGAGPLPSSQELWSAGVPAPMKVRNGHVRVSVPTSSPASRILVVVSSLSRIPGVYPVTLSTVAAREAHPAEIDEGRSRPHRISLPQSLEPPPSRPIVPPPRERDFWLPARDGDPAQLGNHVPVHAILQGHADRVAVYVDANDQARVTGETIRDVIATFEDRVFPRALAETGVARDEDGDGRFTILISGWLGHLADGRISVDGFVRGADFQQAQNAPLGNRCDMMYLNASLQAGPHLRTVIAHEYAHAVTFCRKAHGTAGVDEEGWLDEAMAHLTEDAHGFSRSNLDYRVDTFLNRPERYRLLVSDYSNPELIRSHGHRGSAYSFLRWCGDRFGPSMLRTLVRSELRGVANLEAATGCDFDTLFRDWSVSLYLDSLVADSSARQDPPRASQIAVGETESIELDGTSTHYAVIDGTDEGAVSISVSGPPNARLQVTVVPLPENLSQLRLSADLEPTDSGCPRMRLRIRNPDPNRIRFESLRWFSANPSSMATERIRQCDQKSGEALTKLLGSPDLDGRGYLTSCPIPIGNFPRSGPIVVVLSGRDETGRRVVARAEMRLPEGGFQATR